VFFKAFIPTCILKTMRRIKIVIVYKGNRYQCPFCGSFLRKFIPSGESHSILREKKVIGGGYRKNVSCPVCYSTDRSRLLYLFLRYLTTICTERMSVLHIAPEPQLQRFLESIPKISYLSADINEKKAMVQMDIMHIQYPDEYFDAIICSHVLEHVDNDLKAMAELYRVLKTGGWAILQVPFSPVLQETFEDPSIVTPEEREKKFGQNNHVRLYGNDYVQRLHSVGFHVDVYKWREDPISIHNGNNVYCLNEQEPIFFCKK